MSEPSKWVETVFAVTCPRWPDGVEKRYLKGWSNGIFAIDERSHWGSRSKAWSVTHLGTGYSALSWKGSRATVQKLVDEFAAIADWDFSDPAEAALSGRKSAAQAFRQKHMAAYVEAFNLGAPEFVDAPQ